MAISTTTVSALERELLGAARGGDQDAYRRLVEPHRGELHAHCYRMLGSVHDAEDALQDALLRAWRGLPRFEGRSSLRSWLYRIATNACAERRRAPAQRDAPDRPRPARRSPRPPGAPAGRVGVGRALSRRAAGARGRPRGPEARYERRESVELAFVAALQHLPPNQRAVLILREVLGFSGQEIAEALETTVAAVNSALQRARKAVDERLPTAGQQATLRMLGDSGCPRSSRATWTPWAAATSTPSSPCSRRTRCGRCRRLRAGTAAHDAIAGFLVTAPLNGEWRWRHVPARASGQAAVGSYVWDAKDQTYRRSRSTSCACVAS